MHVIGQSSTFYLCVVVVLCYATCIGATVSYLSSSEVQVGVDTSFGCSITHLQAVVKGTNVVNDNDRGRQVQPSFYSGPRPYHDCEWNGQPWAWNPISSGDYAGHSSEVLSFSNDGSTIKCLVRPLQWGCNQVACNCTFEMEYSVSGTAVIATITLHNNRDDATDYGRFGQELPAAYTNGILYRMVGYNGGEPWQMGNLTEWNADFTGKVWIPGKVDVTEPWVGFVSDEGFMMALYNPGVTSFLGGFNEASKKGSGGEKDSQCGYMAAYAECDLPAQGDFTYSYALVIGNVDDARRTIYDLHSQHPLFSKVDAPLC